MSGMVPAELGSATRSRLPRWGGDSLVCLLGLACLLMVTGCDGCTPQAGPTDIEERNERLARAREKGDFEKPNLKILPHDDREVMLNRVKPGHWTGVTSEMKANNFDFRGQLYAQATDTESQPLPLPQTDYYFSSTRPLALTKGQARWADVLYYPPKSRGAENRNQLFQVGLRDRSRGGELLSESISIARMFAHEYYFVVLAATADQYQFLNLSDNIRSLGVGTEMEDLTPHYRLLLPKVVDRVPLPENPFAWTSIAYILWDDIDPNLLTNDQQEALLDWLHFGGQLIISGPDTLDRLRNSFLQPYLPADDAGSVELEQSDFDVWNEHFVTSESILQDGERQPTEYPVKLRTSGLRGVRLGLREDSHFVPHTGDLVAERQVGRGRIVATAFQTRAVDLSQNWKNFDSFFNATLLRRPPRRFKVDQNENVSFEWVDQELGRNDPRLVSGIRFLSRDLEDRLPLYQRLDAAARSSLGFPSYPPGYAAQAVEQGDELELKSEAYHRFSGFVADPESGVGAWNDYGAVASAARQNLQQAAGISIPKSSFILQVTAGYLLVLIPLNWCVFWMIGRVEWAWIAAPIIAVIGAVTVVKLAELDVGFARSRTELAVIEVPVNYHKGHVTRFSSLYTSLGTRYDMRFTHPNSLSLPFSRDTRAVTSRSGRLASTPTEVQYYQEGTDVSLSGLQVSSNSSTMVHSEYLIPLADRPMFQWNQSADDNDEEANLTYHGELPLKDVGIIRRRKDDSRRIEVAWIGDLSQGMSATARFSQPGDAWTLLNQWDAVPVFSPVVEETEISLRYLLNVVKDVRHLKPGETRLIGWTDQDVDNLEVYPSASQQQIRTLLVAHLTNPPLPEPQGDVNTRRIAGREPAQLDPQGWDPLFEQTIE
ncbi:MAG: hypothetical protein WEE51_02865, partial [Pirellulaceae bacterium]